MRRSVAAGGSHPYRNSERFYRFPPDVGECGAPDRLIVVVGKDEIARRGGPSHQMLAQGREDHVGKRDHPRSVLSILDRAEYRLATHDPGELSVDAHRAAEEVNPIHGESKGLGDTHTCSGSEDHKGLVAIGHSISNRHHSVDFPRSRSSASRWVEGERQHKERRQ